jgi:uncharacterized protein (TIGR00369 family)
MDGYPGVLGVYGESAGNGRSQLRFDAGEPHLNQARTVHGGVLAALVDTAMGLAARSTTQDGETPATSQLTIAYLSAGRPGMMTVQAEVRRRGDHILLCEADVEQDGRSLVHAVATFALL